MSEGIIEVFMDGGFESPSAPALDIVFVHGLGGDQVETWQTDPKSFWPRWLAEKFANCRVSSFGYDSQKLAGFLKGGGASLHDIALALADALTNRENQSSRTLFICHSLGGLIVKQMLRRCSDSMNPEYRELGRSIVGIAFLGTPHAGASLASSLDQLLRRFLSKQTQQLVYGEDGLVDLNDFFRSRAGMQKIQVRAYYETEQVGGIFIVDKVTANPGVLGCEPIAVQTDHLRICKPESKDAPVFKSVCGLIRSLLKDPATSPEHGGGSALGQSSGTAQAGAAAGTGATQTVAGVSADIARDFEYFTTVAEDDRRDLEQKLKDSGRAYAVRDAKRKKEMFNMALQRHIAQPAAVTRYTRLMSDVESRFKRHVVRAIAEGGCAGTVDTIIQKDVISPCAEVESDGEALTAGLVDGALYYLAGNCHVAWDNG